MDTKLILRKNKKIPFFLFIKFNNSLAIIFIGIVFLFNNPNGVFGQYSDSDIDGDAYYKSKNPTERAINAKIESKNEALCVIQYYLKMRGVSVSLASGCPQYPDTAHAFSTLSGICASYEYHAFVLPYREALMPFIKKEKNIDYCDYDNATFLTLLDNERLYRDSIKRGGYCENTHADAKAKRGYALSIYENALRELIDTENYSDFHKFFYYREKYHTLSYHNLFRFAQELIFVNDKEVNKLFWEAFECKREIPVVYYSGSTRDKGVISVAFAFGAAIASYFYEPFFYNILSNPYSVAQVNGLPFDEKTYNDYIPIMERYIRYISGQKVKIPFLLKFNSQPILASKYYDGYNHYPIPAKYYSLPDTCIGAKGNEFPLNFYYNEK